MNRDLQATKSRKSGSNLPGCSRPLTAAEHSCLSCQVPGDCNDNHPLCTYHQLIVNKSGKWNWLAEKAQTIAPGKSLTVTLESPQQLSSARGAISKRTNAPSGYTFITRKIPVPGTDTVHLKISLVPK